MSKTTSTGMAALLVMTLVTAPVAQARADVPVPLPVLLAAPDPSGDGETPGGLQPDALPTANGADGTAAVPGLTQSQAMQGQGMDDEETPVWKNWWFWALTGVIVGGTVALGVWASQPSDRPARACMPGQFIACFGDGQDGLR